MSFNIKRISNKVIKSVNKVVSNMNADSLSQELGAAGSEDAVIDGKMSSLCRKAASQGAVLLKNDGVLPLKTDDVVSVFGRCAFDWFCVGYGSGGDVASPYKTSLIEGLRENDVRLNEELINIYNEWRSKPENEPMDGFWGHWPYAHDEMKLNEKTVKEASELSDVAVVVIGRAAGEDRENTLKKGVFYLSDIEENMIKLVSENFGRVVIVADIGNIIDFSFTEKYDVGALLLPWQGGMESGNAVADVLTGKVTPSGKLSDSIARTYEDYPSSYDFGNKKFNNYTEDIFVGYRFFETFAPIKVLYPFGFGLSYTSFEIYCDKIKKKGTTADMAFTVKNTGNCSGRETVQIYISAPEGKLGKASKVLIAFAKTSDINSGESENVEIKIDISTVSSYDDSGVTGYKSAFVLESGDYLIFAGNNVRDAEQIGVITVKETIVTEQLSEVMAVKPENRFNRIINRDGLNFERVPAVTTCLKRIIKNRLPDSIEYTGDKGYKLIDMKSGKITLDEFVSQLSLDDLEALSRGEGGMDSDLGTKGNAGAFGGITKSLREKGVPPVITTDGPAGIRLKIKCSLLPCGTLLACTWDSELVEELYSCVADEMIVRGSDVLLAPGMNIHRNPLCGRNFEYFSEDPYLSGMMASSVVNGLQHDGISACPKHFACNNQETNRNYCDSRVSERALREIYLKNFEICIKESKPLNVMTSYNKINGVWSHYNYELCETVLRKEWGYKGNVMTDWWMRYSSSPEFSELRGNGYRVRSRVDLLMPGGKNFADKQGKPDGTLLETYMNYNGITLGEMQRVAKDILSMILESRAMDKI